MDAKKLINELIEISQKNIQEVLSFKDLPDRVLNQKYDPETWSVLECIEHLNRYGNFYIPEIRKQIDNSKHNPAMEFKSGMLGNYFAKSMLPRDRLNKMKTFKSMNPNNSSLDRNVLDTFIHQQQQMVELLEKARKTNLTKVKTAISIAKWIKLRLGDTLRVVVYHNLRHIVQAKKAIASSGYSSGETLTLTNHQRIQ